MNIKEKSLDYYIANKLEEANIKYDAQGSSIKELSEALSTASKAGTGNIGFPEFVAVSSGIVLVIEDKRDTDFHICVGDDGDITEDTKSIKDYAVNGAVHYAKHIIENTSYERAFAIGASGTEKHHKIQPVYVDKENVLILEEMETFENFKNENIDTYYRTRVLGETPPEEVELTEIIRIAKELHEDLRNYGGLTEQEKPLVVSALLLALEDEPTIIDRLKGDDVNKDGQIIYTALKNYLIRAKVRPEVKREAILTKFAFIIDRPQLNNFDERLGSTALAYFAKTVSQSISDVFKINSKEDILGRFYGEFIKYSGGDGKGLGIVLTPSHITELFCELLDIKPSDTIFDPTCGDGVIMMTQARNIGNRVA